MFTLIQNSSNALQMAKNGKNVPPGLLQYKVKKDDIINMDIREHMVIMNGNLQNIAKRIY